MVTKNMFKIEPCYLLTISRDKGKNASKASYIDLKEKSISKLYKENICPIVLFAKALESDFFETIIFK